jgi:hypothetical protein
LFLSWWAHYSNLLLDAPKTVVKINFGISTIGLVITCSSFSVVSYDNSFIFSPRWPRDRGHKEMNPGSMADVQGFWIRIPVSVSVVRWHGQGHYRNRVSPWYLRLPLACFSIVNWWMIHSWNSFEFNIQPWGRVFKTAIPSTSKKTAVIVFRWYRLSHVKCSTGASHD